MNPLSDTSAAIPEICGSVEAPEVGETFIVDKFQSQTVFGVTCAIGATDSGSLTLTVGEDEVASKVYYDGLLFTTGSPYVGSTNTLTITAASTGAVTMAVDAALANSTIEPAGDETVCSTTISCSAPNVKLTVNVPALTMSNKVKAPVIAISANGQIYRRCRFA